MRIVCLSEIAEKNEDHLQTWEEYRWTQSCQFQFPRLHICSTLEGAQELKCYRYPADWRTHFWWNRDLNPPVGGCCWHIFRPWPRRSVSRDGHSWRGIGVWSCSGWSGGLWLWVSSCSTLLWEVLEHRYNRCSDEYISWLCLKPKKELLFIDLFHLFIHFREQTWRIQNIHLLVYNTCGMSTIYDVIGISFNTNVENKQLFWHTCRHFRIAAILLYEFLCGWHYDAKPDA